MKATMICLPVLLLGLLCMNVHASSEHDHPLRGLIDPVDITDTATVSGSWSDPTLWSSGQLPGTDASVLIPAGVTVTHDLLDPTELTGVLVEGVLQFSTSQSSQIILDTLLIELGGRLEIGSLTAPIPQGVNIDILIRDIGDINVADDPTLIGRGVIARGQVDMHGAIKTAHLKVSVDPRAGDQQLTLATAPDNWSVGDTLVLTGTRYSGWKWDNSIGAVRYHGTQDEILTISSVNGNIVSFSETLAFDHLTPRADLKASVANMSRNITIATQNPDTTPRHRRGHMMFMHHPNVDVRYVSIWQLGRTDKSIPSLEATDFATITPTSNVRGRYSFHFHRGGIENPRNPGVSVGNAVFGSPGWGYVHHDSNALFHNNISFDTFGAGFVAETGNEIGAWTNNLAIKAEGNRAFNPKNGNDRELFDMGRTGDGFWFQGRMVRSVGNIAASVNHGFVYLHRGSGMLSFPSSAFMLPEALTRNGLSGVDDAPILSFIDNESFASTVGLYVVKANPNQQHDIHSHFRGFTAWEVQAGSAMEYTSHYLLEDFDIIGLTPEPFRSPFFGIEFGTNTSDMTINRAQISNMEIGVILSKDYTNPTPPEANQYVLIDVEMDQVNQDFEDYDPNLDLILTNADLLPGQFDVTVNGNVHEFLSPATTAGSGVPWVGSKLDSIGNSPVPAGTDNIGMPVFDMIALCAEDGYYRTSDGTPYAIVEEFFTDRATGEIHKLAFKTLLGPQVETRLGNQFSVWADAFQAGTIDLDSLPPTPQDDVLAAQSAVPTILNLISNDSDPDGDPVSIDGIVQPEHGRVFDNQDGTVTYISDFEFIGNDHFEYWATDRQGHYSKAIVDITVSETLPAELFSDGFED